MNVTTNKSCIRLSGHIIMAHLFCASANKWVGEMSCKEITKCQSFFHWVQRRKKYKEKTRNKQTTKINWTNQYSKCDLGETLRIRLESWTSLYSRGGGVCVYMSTCSTVQSAMWTLKKHKMCRALAPSRGHIKRCPPGVLSLQREKHHASFKHLCSFEN